MARLLKAWKWVVRFALLLGLFSDLFNLVQWSRFWRRPESARPLVFEDFSPTGLPKCAFSEPLLREEAEPDWYLNFFDWFLGFGRAEENAYAKAEYKIWKNLVSGGPTSAEVQILGSGSSLQEMGRIHKEFAEEGGCGTSGRSSTSMSTAIAPSS